MSLRDRRNKLERAWWDFDTPDENEQYATLGDFILEHLYDYDEPKDGIDSVREIVKKRCKKLQERVNELLEEIKDEESDDMDLDESLQHAKKVSAAELLVKFVDELVTIVEELPMNPFEDE